MKLFGKIILLFLLLIAAGGVAIWWVYVPAQPPIRVENLPDAEEGFPLSAAYKTAEVLYQNGDYDAAFPLFLALANQGDPLAQFRVGEAYDKGQGIDGSYTLALTWFEKADQHSMPRAKNALGRMMYIGRGIPKDRKRARDLFLAAANAGNSAAARNMAILRSRPDSVFENPDEAKYWWIRAAEGGDVEALVTAAHRYFLYSDGAKYIQYLERAAKQGNAIAHIGLADARYEDYFSRVNYPIGLCVAYWFPIFNKKFDACDFLIRQAPN